MSANSVKARLEQRGLSLPPATQAAGAYVTAAQSGALLFLSGHVCKRDGAIVTGKAGADLTTATAQELARLCALELLATADHTVGLDAVTRVVKVVGFVNSTLDFTEQTAVINAASELLVDVFGEAIGAHARSAVGAVQLPFGAAVEIEAVLEVQSRQL